MAIKNSVKIAMRASFKKDFLVKCADFTENRCARPPPRWDVYWKAKICLRVH